MNEVLVVHAISNKRVANKKASHDKREGEDKGSYHEEEEV